MLTATPENPKVKQEVEETIKKNEEAIFLLKVAITDEIMKHPLMVVINTFADHNTDLAREMRDTFVDEMLTEIYFAHEDHFDNIDIKKLIEEHRIFIDVAYDELTRKSDDDIVITYEDLKKFDENFPELLYKQILVIVQYINAFGFSKIIRNTMSESADIVVRTMIFISAYLDSILKYSIGPTEEDKEKQRVHIRDVIHNRDAIKQMMEDIKNKSDEVNDK